MTASEQKAYPGFPSAVTPNPLCGVALYLGLTPDSWVLRSVPFFELSSSCAQELTAWSAPRYALCRMMSRSLHCGWLSSRCAGVAAWLLLLGAPSLLAQGHINGWMDPPEPSKAPRFEGKSLPSPRMQKELWLAPPTDVPTNYVTATRALFDAGLADPRDCAYREIEVGLASVGSMDRNTPTNGVLKTRGWLLPGATKPRFAICWNGLVYPAISVGPKADLGVDVAALATNGFLPHGTGFLEAESLSPNSLLGIKGCLLLRLGKGEAARTVWQVRTRLKREPVLQWSMPRTNGLPGLAETRLPEEDPYVDWAIEWAWALFDRTTYAFMRGDDGLALPGCRALSTLITTVESEADRRGFRRPNYSNYVPRRWSGHHLYFLQPVAVLLADEERRLLKRTRPTAVETGVVNDRGHRIAALVAGLEDIAILLGSWRGNQTVDALVAEGPEVVEPLLTCLERDGTNLTRSLSVGQGREGFTRERGLHTIAEPVCAILQAVMQTTSFDLWAEKNDLTAAGTNANRITATKIRAYWRKFRDVPLEERWYQTLTNDNAGTEAWREAAGRITEPLRSGPGTNASRMRGEALRAKTNPSVSELLDRRIRQTTPRSVDYYNFENARGSVSTIVRWDPKAAISTLRFQMRIALEAADSTDYGFLNYGQQTCLSTIVDHTLTRT